MSDWYYYAENEQKGPIPEAELKGSLQALRLPGETLVWKEGMEGWVAARDLAEFSIAPAAAPAPRVIETPALTPAITYPVVLEQRNVLRGKQFFTLVSDEVIGFETGKGRRKIEARVLLSTLEPEPRRKQKLDYIALFLAGLMLLLLLGVLCALVVALLENPSADNVVSFSGTAGVLTLFTAFLVGHAYSKCPKIIVFDSPTGTPVTLWQGNPDKVTVEKFVNQVQSAIIHARAKIQPVVEGPAVCAHCQSPDVVPGHSSPLCAPCRVVLINRPVPMWLKITGCVLILLALISAVRMPWELSAYANFERGQNAEKANRNAEAAQAYQKALQIYPRSLDILTHLARVSLRAGDDATAIDSVNRIIAEAGPGKSVPKETVEVVEEVKKAHP